MRNKKLKCSVSSLLIAAFALSLSGCATLKNTKLPSGFIDLGICPRCHKVISVDELSDDEFVVCPECSARFTVGCAKYAFKKKCVDLKNKKTAITVLSVAWMVASIAGAVYGVPIPPPPISEETFTPYKLPMLISCKKAIHTQPAVPGEYPETPVSESRGLYTDHNPLEILSDRYGLYESPYSVVIEDKFYDNNGIIPVTAPYDISLGKINNNCYD